MEAYRDQYAKLFKNGRKVTVIGISVDADTMLANWARESDFPIVFASDSGSVIGKQYAAYDTTYKVDNRSLFVVAPDGHIAYETSSFKVLSPAAYAELAQAVAKVTPAAAPPAAAPPAK
jgi:thioredoxin-dependent peroxiredoxin